MDWIIWNTSQRKWVGPSGRPSAYVRLRSAARRFPSKEAAEAECCGDESAVIL